MDSYWVFYNYWNMVTWFSYVHFFLFQFSSGCQLRTMRPNLLTKKKSSSIMLPKYAYQSQKRTMLVFPHWLQLQTLAKQATSTSIVKIWNTLSLHNQMYKVIFDVHNTKIETFEGLVILYRMPYLVYNS